jgi:hypothetical protein
VADKNRMAKNAEAMAFIEKPPGFNGMMLLPVAGNLA